MKKIIVAVFFVCFITFLSAKEYEKIEPEMLVDGMKGRICGMGVADYNEEQLAEDRGKLEVAKNMMAYNADDKSDNEAKLKEFIAKNFKKIEVFGTWKWGGKIYKLMCLLTEEEIQKRIDKMLLQELTQKLTSGELRCLFGYPEYYDGMLSKAAKTEYIWPIKNKIYPSREDFVAGDDTAGFISSLFGDDRNHTGIDLAFKEGTPVYAAASGIVSFAGCDSKCGEVCDDKCDKGYGKYIIISHPDGMRTLYAHLQEFKYLRGTRKDFFMEQTFETLPDDLKDASVQELKKGDCVKQGDQIGLVGHTGVVVSATDGTGSHLHFEIRKYSNPVDPMRYLPDLSLKLVEESKMREQTEKEIEDFKIKETMKEYTPDETDDKTFPEGQKE